MPSCCSIFTVSWMIWSMTGKVSELHRNYHIPISNTAAATMLFGNEAVAQRKAA